MVNAFRWTRRGLIFAPDGRFDWMHSYAQNPTGFRLGDIIRVYFTCRPAMATDGNFVSRIARVDLSKDNLADIVGLSERPILDLGPVGTFDQFGVMPGNVIEVGSEKWLYYVGWNRCQGVPYNHAIGLAISKDDGTTFTRFGSGPVITRSPTEPFIQNSPFVAVFDGLFHIWYSTGLGWIESNGRLESIYAIVHGISKDGINWERTGKLCIPSKVDLECQTNPSILFRGGRYHMWFCYRCGVEFRNAERGYRIGYAYSDDLVNWFRDDSAGQFLPSGSGWDSDMTCYPWVFEIDSKTYMFYSGNYMGRDGFGFAELA